MSIMISANLRTLRKHSRYTLEEAAEIIGVSLIKEPIQLLADASPNDKGQYMFGIVKVSDTGEITIPDKAKEIMEIFPGDRLLILGDKRQGIAVLKCDGLNDYLDLGEGT